MDKKRKRRFAFLAAAALIAAFSLIAQPMLAEAKGGFRQPKSADSEILALTERLGLTPEQVAAVRPVIEEKILRYNEIWSRTDTDRETRRAEMRRLRWDSQIRLSEVLTDEQVDRYLALKHEQRKGHRRGGHRGDWMKKGIYRTPEKIIERLSARLHLTEGQAAQAGPIIQESIERKRAVFEKYREQGMNMREAMRSEIQAIGDSMHEELEAILSDEQLGEFNAIKQEKRVRVNKWKGGHGFRWF